MDDELRARAAGYTWALTQPRYADYDEFASYGAFADQCGNLRDDERVVVLFQAWERGVVDADWLLREDAMISPSDIVRLLDERVSLRYIQAELKAGRLRGQKFSSDGKRADWAVFPDDFREWLKNHKWTSGKYPRRPDKQIRAVLKKAGWSGSEEQAESVLAEVWALMQSEQISVEQAVPKWLEIEYGVGEE